MHDSAEPAPFAQAAPFYDRFRPPYASDAIGFVASAFGLGEGVRVLDLGCGPGTLAIPLSRTGAEVVAVDTCEAMLAEGRRLAAERGAGRIRWVQGRAEDVLSQQDRFRLAAFGQSLHWMDRDLVLHRVAGVIEDGGGIAVFDQVRRGPPEAWQDVAVEVRARYLDPDARHPDKHAESAHEPSLRRSDRFSSFTPRAFPSRIVHDVRSILGRLYSRVDTAPSMFGAAREAFEAELEAALLARSPSGAFAEAFETRVLLAPKGA